MLAADLIGLLAALAIAEWASALRSPAGTLDSRLEIGVFIASLPLWVVTAKLYGLYDHDEERTDHSTADDFAGVFHMVTVCTFLFWAGSLLTSLAHPPATKLLVFWAAAIGLLGGLVGLGIALASLAGWLLLHYPGPDAISGTFASVVLALMIFGVAVVSTLIAKD